VNGWSKFDSWRGQERKEGIKIISFFRKLFYTNINSFLHSNMTEVHDILKEYL
jgi:hypothetical protein